MRRALNQRTARDLSYEGFLDLAASLECVGVEVRNDLGRPVFDGIAPEEAGRMARDRGLRLLGVSEVYGFNVWDSDREAEIAALIDTADAAGAGTISLIPTVDHREARSLRDVLRDVLPMVTGRPVCALIEPIGFRTSSLRDKAELVDAIEAVGGTGKIKMIHDTFQHALTDETALFPEYTGIVHISGISSTAVPLDDAQDAHRVLVDADDRCCTLNQVRVFIEAGYDGAFSFECTDDTLIRTISAAQIEASFAYLEHKVAAA